MRKNGSTLSSEQRMDLPALRQHRGISLREIADSTKISMRFLLAIDHRDGLALCLRPSVRPDRSGQARQRHRRPASGRRSRATARACAGATDNFAMASGLAPTEPGYRRLLEAYRRLRDRTAAADLDPIGAGPVLKLGASGPRVAALQGRLRRFGDLRDGPGEPSSTRRRATRSPRSSAATVLWTTAS